MINNLVLRRLRYALNLREDSMQALFLLAGHKIKPFSISCLLKKEDEEGYIECTDVVLEKFLDGLIIDKRGVKEEPAESTSVPSTERVRLNNNIILKKIRVALELREEDMLEVMKLADFRVTKAELGALFRKRGSRNFKPCGDQFMRNFLTGLCLKFRPKD